jgi:hypothetical protein
MTVTDKVDDEGYSWKKKKSSFSLLLNTQKEVILKRAGNAEKEGIRI